MEEDTDKTDFQKKLEKSEENLKAQLKATTESTDRKLIAMSNNHVKNLETQAATFKMMLDKQAATNKAMIDLINQSNQANQTEMREKQKQDNAGLKDLMASMIGALKAELSTIITGNQQVTGAGNQPAQVNLQQQQPLRLHIPKTQWTCTDRQPNHTFSRH
eukprot:scaffold159598_cov52-Attheya_sp.AAC.1